MGFFSCCMGERKQCKGDAEARHARLIEIYRQAEVELERPVHSPPPAYNEVVFDVISGTPIFVEEKRPQPVLQPVAMEQHPHPRSTISRPASPQTSVYSVPSTRLTDIMSMHTGGTVAAARTHQGDSPRSSLVFDSAPPSYYDGRSMRERSRSPHDERNSVEQRHPVMREDWLEVLTRTAEQEASTR